VQHGLSTLRTARPGLRTQIVLWVEANSTGGKKEIFIGVSSSFRGGAGPVNDTEQDKQQQEAKLSLG